MLITLYRIDNDVNERDITSCSSQLHSVRSVFFIDEKKVIKLILSYPLSIGRSITEIIRIVDALQTSSRCGVLTPANWQRVSFDFKDYRSKD
jgi:alkyl hydroperoxide reductase subunit AhpC